MSKHSFTSLQDLDAFLGGRQFATADAICLTGPDCQLLSKAMYEAAKLESQRKSLGAKYAFGTFGTGVAVVAGVVAAPIAIPAFLCAVAASLVGKSSVDERDRTFMANYPFGRRAHELHARGWRVAQNTGHMVELTRK